MHQESDKIYGSLTNQLVKNIDLLYTMTFITCLNKFILKFITLERVFSINKIYVQLIIQPLLRHIFSQFLNCIYLIDIIKIIINIIVSIPNVATILWKLEER